MGVLRHLSGGQRAKAAFMDYLLLFPVEATPWPRASGFCYLDIGARIADTSYHATQLLLAFWGFELGSSGLHNRFYSLDHLLDLKHS